MSNRYTLHVGDSLAVLPTLPADSVDAIVTDPPYGLSFMGKEWDHGVPGEPFWREALRVAKPGAHLLAFGGTRTFHRLACAIEDAGWEIRDCVMWVYGSGFPKSLDVSKAIDKEAGAEREVVGETTDRRGDGTTYGLAHSTRLVSGDGVTEAAQRWQGWGTALKPAWEPIIVARKPLAGTVADNVTRHGTGAINVDACRIGQDAMLRKASTGVVASQIRAMSGPHYVQNIVGTAVGRWPANVIHDGSEEATNGMGDAARYFYSAKASRSDRNDGCEHLPEQLPHPPSGDGRAWGIAGTKSQARSNHHPTVKPTALMRYLCRLITPPGGLVLDPFTGSGSTGKAALLEGFRFVGIELSKEYAEIAEARIKSADQKSDKGDVSERRESKPKKPKAEKPSKPLPKSEAQADIQLEMF